MSFLSELKNQASALQKQQAGTAQDHAVSISGPAQPLWLSSRD